MITLLKHFYSSYFTATLSLWRFILFILLPSFLPSFLPSYLPSYLPSFLPLLIYLSSSLFARALNDSFLHWSAFLQSASILFHLILPPNFESLPWSLSHYLDVWVTTLNLYPSILMLSLMLSVSHTLTVILSLSLSLSLSLYYLFLFFSLPLSRSNNSWKWFSNQHQSSSSLLQNAWRQTVLWDLRRSWWR